MHERAVQNAPRDQQVGQNLALAPEGENVKLLDREVPQGAGVIALDVSRPANPLWGRVRLGPLE